MPEERYAYPARVPGEPQQVEPVPPGTGWWHGRLIELGREGGVLAAAGRARPFRLRLRDHGAQVGDIVSLRGHEAKGAITADAVSVLAPSLRLGLHPPTDPGPRLSLRQAVLAAVREYFRLQGFVEVETPAMVVAPGQEPHLDPFITGLHLPVGEDGQRYLITSPEHHMKRLLGQGCERIFQVCRCFRDGERSHLHRPEFVMVEWYRAWASYRQIAAEVADLVAHVSRRVLGTTRVAWAGRSLELASPWKRLTVREAFRTLAGVELRPGDDAGTLCRAARRAGCHSVAAEDSWEDAFHKVLLDLVEPALAELGAVLLEEYPAPLAALAKLKDGEPSVAERFEAYVGGVELANGFTELNDPREQRRRFMEERQQRRARGVPAVPLDEAFLAMMEAGMPPAGGVALGLDRLVMVLGNARSIDETVAFPGE